MPGYLSDRLISFVPASAADLANVQGQINNINVTLLDHQEQIDDLGLNIGV
jgi:hypothetical protein